MNLSQAEIRELLAGLAEVSFVAHRDALAALPAIERHGAQVAATWLKACRALFLHDRDMGLAFIRASPAAEQASETVLPWTEQALEFLCWRGSWKAVKGFVENLPRAYDLLGHAGEGRWAEIGLRWCQRHLESGAVYFCTPVEELAGRQGITGVEQITAPAEELFETRRLTLASYLLGAIRVRNLLGAQAVLPWAKQGADILQAGRLRGEAYFRLESEESLRILLEQVPGYRLPEHRRFLGLLLAAWYPEPIEIKESNWSPEKGRPFVESDGRALFIPAAMPDREESVLAVLHCAGHIAFGPHDREAITALFEEVGLSALAGAEPSSLDSASSITWNPLLAAYGEDRLRFQLLFDLCEDLRVDWRIQGVIPNYLRRLARLAEARSPRPGAGYYALALDSVRRAAGLGGDGRWDETWERLVRLLEEEATIVDAFRTASVLYRNLDLPPVATLEERNRAYLPGRSPNASRPLFLRGSLTRTRRAADGAEPGLGQDKERSARRGITCCNTPQDGEGSEPPALSNSGAAASMGAGAPRAAGISGGGRAPAPSERGFPYPEWDYREGRYKRNWAWVQERSLSETNLAEAQRLTSLYASVLVRLKRAIQAQKPTRLAPLKRQLEGDEIDLGAAVDFMVERRLGRSPRPAVYRQRRRELRDTAVMLLADLSTSVMQQLPEGQGRVVDRIRAGILLFAEAMEVVGDAYAIAGFSSKYRDNVSYYPIKGFREPLTSAVRAVVGGLSGRLATRMGAAIRHALQRFEQAPSSRRLLLILSDGRPEDYDDGGDARYLHEDTRVAVKEAVDRGVHPFCITLDPAGSEYLPRIFGRGHYLVLDHIDRLPEKLPEIYLRLRA